MGTLMEVTMVQLMEQHWVNLMENPKDMRTGQLMDLYLVILRAKYSVHQMEILKDEKMVQLTEQHWEYLLVQQRECLTVEPMANH